ncbi:MAG: Na+/H+ antiporter subunit C [Nitrospinota bacterium]|nr:Na+/H+ antiporter subunit C [Nitrospinota bacterium]
MFLILPLTIGVLVTVSVFLIIQRRIIKVVLGFAMLSHATNLMIMASGWVRDGKPPILPAEKISVQALMYVDPLPQAMVLTAIVISLAVIAFLLTVALNMHRNFKTDNIDKYRRLKG